MDPHLAMIFALTPSTWGNTLAAISSGGQGMDGRVGVRRGQVSSTLPSFAAAYLRT